MIILVFLISDCIQQHLLAITVFKSTIKKQLRTKSFFIFFPSFMSFYTSSLISDLIFLQKKKREEKSITKKLIMHILPYFVCFHKRWGGEERKKTFVIKLRKRDFSFYYYNNTLRFELCPYILLTKTVLGGGLQKKNIINITQKTTFLFTIYLRTDTYLNT